MRIVEEKIDQFYKDIMEDVNEKRKDILDAADRDIHETLEKRELEFLEKAYSKIQNGLKGINREKNEIISRAVMASKRKLLNKREAIINDIYEGVVKELYRFKNSKAYQDYLLNGIQSAMKDFDTDDEIDLYILKEDEPLVVAFKDKMNIVFDDETMIGGYKLHNKTKHIYMNESLRSLLDGQKEKMYEICKIDLG